MEPDCGAFTPEPQPVGSALRREDVRACGADLRPWGLQEVILPAARGAAGVFIVNHNDSHLGT